MSGEASDPIVISESFFDALGNPVAKDDPAAVAVEIEWLDADGETQRTYADL